GKRQNVIIKRCFWKQPQECTGRFSPRKINFSNRSLRIRKIQPDYRHTLSNLEQAFFPRKRHSPPLQKDRRNRTYRQSNRNQSESDRTHSTFQRIHLYGGLLRYTHPVCTVTRSQNTGLQTGKIFL